MLKKKKTNIKCVSAPAKTTAANITDLSILESCIKMSFADIKREMKELEQDIKQYIKDRSKKNNTKK